MTYMISHGHKEIVEDLIRNSCINSNDKMKVGDNLMYWLDCLLRWNIKTFFI